MVGSGSTKSCWRSLAGSPAGNVALVAFVVGFVAAGWVFVSAGLTVAEDLSG